MFPDLVQVGSSSFWVKSSFQAFFRINDVILLSPLEFFQSFLLWIRSIFLSSIRSTYIEALNVLSVFLGACSLDSIRWVILCWAYWLFSYILVFLVFCKNYANFFFPSLSSCATGVGRFLTCFSLVFIHIPHELLAYRTINFTTI